MIYSCVLSDVCFERFEEKPHRLLSEYWYTDKTDIYDQEKKLINNLSLKIALAIRMLNLNFLDAMQAKLKWLFKVKDQYDL